MEKMLKLEERKGQSRHKPYVIGVGHRILEYKKSRGAATWRSNTLMECIATKHRPNTKISSYIKVTNTKQSTAQEKVESPITRSVAKTQSVKAMKNP